MEKLNSLISADPNSYIPKIKTILRPGGLEKNFDRLLNKDVYLSLNYDGLNGKRGLKEFQSLHDVIYEALKEDGYTIQVFKKKMQHCFKIYKNRFFSKKSREKESKINIKNT
ncbi:uncharacterized protein LOC119612747 [Lucilia sericata]|uniref:uncharacterized protein LOC119612747 n=1 Tax=Lucilia sericata TaxID=13632 RepID=UPI0018A850EA|nr:uncharacterized protein LOC119612747 [Lucilia sericata]XP_037824533.1 uncharacterized protein LOC119612747 [Lucilia sericata]